MEASGKEVSTFADFMRLFLQINPENRGTIDEISHHRWLVSSEV